MYILYTEKNRSENRKIEEYAFGPECFLILIRYKNRLHNKFYESEGTPPMTNFYGSWTQLPGGLCQPLGKSPEAAWQNQWNVTLFWQVKHRFSTSFRNWRAALAPRSNTRWAGTQHWVENTMLTVVLEFSKNANFGRVWHHYWSRWVSYRCQTPKTDCRSVFLQQTESIYVLRCLFRKIYRLHSQCLQ